MAQNLNHLHDDRITDKGYQDTALKMIIIFKFKSSLSAPAEASFENVRQQNTDKVNPRVLSYVPIFYFIIFK